jgi:hypothetical protein
VRLGLTKLLAQELGCTVVTGDPEFKEVESFVPVMWLV